MQLFLIFFLLFALCIWPTTQESKNPHIVFILADDLGWNDVGFHGSNQIPTPNIDTLAYTGIILNKYYVTPICTPSRSALLTGKYPIHTGLQHGVIHGSAPYGLGLHEKILPEILKKGGYTTRAVGKWHLGMQHKVIYESEPWGLSLHEKILSQYLKEAGYATSIVGKWHLGHFSKDYLPENRWFDSHYGYWTGRQDYYDHTATEKSGFWGYDMRRGMNIVWSDYGNYSTDLFTNEAVKIVQEHDKRKPLFLYLAHLATHSANYYNPLEAPTKTVKKFNYIKNKDRRIFAAMLSKLDDSVGMVVQALAQANMLQDSIIVFSTDNGGPAAGFNQNAASNWPLRGVKDTLWEGGVRGVGLVWSPLLPRTGISNAMIHITDWLPTLLSLTNATSPNFKIDGLNIWEHLSTGNPTPREEILLNIDTERNVSGLIYQNWKYIQGKTYKNWNGWYGPSGRGLKYQWQTLNHSVAAKAMKCIKQLPSKIFLKKIRTSATVSCTEDFNNEVYENGEEFLFNLDEDPCEHTNLAAHKPDIIKLMRKKMEEYLKSVIPPRNKPADPRSNPANWGYAWINWMDYV